MTLVGAADVLIQPDGGIVAAGWSGAEEDDVFDFALARYLGK